MIRKSMPSGNDPMGGNLVHVPASAATTTFRKEADERMKSFSASTTRKNSKPPNKSKGHTQSGMASLPNIA